MLVCVCQRVSLLDVCWSTITGEIPIVSGCHRATAGLRVFESPVNVIQVGVGFTESELGDSLGFNDVESAKMRIFIDFIGILM